MVDKHTPGPWEVVGGTDVFTYMNGSRADGTPAVFDDGWQVADCGPRLTRVNEDDWDNLPYCEQAANARLIAQAPAMLHVLRLLLALPANKPYLGPPYWKLVQEIVDAATKETP